MTAIAMGIYLLILVFTDIDFNTWMALLLLFTAASAGKLWGMARAKKRFTRSMATLHREIRYHLLINKPSSEPGPDKNI